MINIAHPKTRDKPPLKEYSTVKSSKDRKLSKTSPGNAEENTELSMKQSRLNNNDIKNNSSVKDLYEPNGKMNKSLINDYNQNIIEPNSTCFEEVRTVMSELENLNPTPATISMKVPLQHEFEGKKCIMQLEPERDTSGRRCLPSGVTYEDLMSFLGKLEQDSMDEMTRIIPEINGSMEKVAVKSQRSLHRKCNRIEAGQEYAFKEDLDMARLELEEKEAAIILLKNQLKSERKIACEKFDALRKNHAGKLQSQEEKYKVIVSRHQKFIEQLIEEKTDLTEKCDSLTQRLKEMDAKVQRDLRVVSERHAVELQRMKEHCAAAEKIRRERWVETRTSKIKEMTVKGLEPELRNMVTQHEEEIQRLRNAHMQELQDAELRIVRQCNHQLEQLRLELTASHEKMLTNEKNILWSRYKESLEEREAQFQMDRKKLQEEVEREKTRIIEEQSKRDADREATLQQDQSRFQKEAEALKQQYANEKRNLEKSLRTEWEMWLAKYKRQQVAKFEESENKIRDDCNKERDRQIELAIERLEEESRESEQKLRQSFENKLKTHTEKYDMDMQTMMESEKLQKEKFLHLRKKLDDTEQLLLESKNKLEEYIANFNTATQTITRLTEEKDNAKKAARQEVEGEKRELEDKIASLYEEISQSNLNHETSIAQLHSRIKLIMTQKMLVIRNLTQELNDSKLRCEHLEKLLDQQRKEYILKTL